MLINELKVYNKHSSLLSIVQIIMNDKTSHAYECDVIVDYDDVLYVMSPEYDIVVREDEGLYRIRVFDYVNMIEHVHYACSIINVTHIIQNIHIFKDIYTYSYMYEYLLGDEYIVKPILIGCDCIHICIVDVANYDTVASVIFTRHSDNTMSYRYGCGYGEYKVNSCSKILHEFLEGWV